MTRSQPAPASSAAAASSAVPSRYHAHGARRLLGGGDGFPCGAIQRAVALLGDDQHAHWITLASSRNFATSCRAASAGEPLKSSVFFAFSGT